MLVNVIIPMYNSEQYLSQCLESLVVQSYERWKAIIVDDGSSDQSVAIANTYCEKDDRFIVIHKKNEGQFRARLDGIRAADGDVIMFLDSDDWLDSTCLEKVVISFEDYVADVVLFPAQVVNDCGESLRKIGQLNAVSGVIDRKVVYERVIGSHDLNSLCTKAFKRELFRFDQLGLLQKKAVRYAEDKLMLLPLITNAKKFCYLDDSLYIYRHHGQSISRHYDATKISEMIAKPVFTEIYRYMMLWNMDDKGNVKRLELHYLKHLLSCYYAIRKSCVKKCDRNLFRQYPWKEEVGDLFARYMKTKDLTVKEKIKLLVMRLSL